jgi:hypothetical protein
MAADEKRLRTPFALEQVTTLLTDAWGWFPSGERERDIVDVRTIVNEIEPQIFLTFRSSSSLSLSPCPSPPSSSRFQNQCVTFQATKTLRLQAEVISDYSDQIINPILHCTVHTFKNQRQRPGRRLFSCSCVHAPGCTKLKGLSATNLTLPNLQKLLSIPSLYAATKHLPENKEEDD